MTTFGRATLTRRSGHSPTPAWSEGLWSMSWATLRSRTVLASSFGAGAVSPGPSRATLLGTPAPQTPNNTALKSGHPRDQLPPSRATLLGTPSPETPTTTPPSTETPGPNRSPKPRATLLGTPAPKPPTTPPQPAGHPGATSQQRGGIHAPTWPGNPHARNVPPVRWHSAVSTRNSTVPGDVGSSESAPALAWITGSQRHRPLRRLLTRTRGSCRAPVTSSGGRPSASGRLSYGE